MSEREERLGAVVATWPIGAKTTASSCWPIGDADALASAIIAGHLDASLDAVNHRTHAIPQHRREAALARLAVGDPVRFVNTAKPQYLRGLAGEIHDLYGDLVVSVGKFKFGHVGSRLGWGSASRRLAEPESCACSHSANLQRGRQGLRLTVLNQEPRR